MRLEEKDIENIRILFSKMESRDDLLHLLNISKPFIYRKNTVPFDLKQLTWYTNPKNCPKRYVEFKIKKKSGAERSIHAPVPGLKALQKALSLILQCVFEPHKAAMGFVRGRSIVDNAALHAGSRYVYNIDLKDFFPSIDQARVWKCFQIKPFNLVDFEKSEIEESIKLKTGVRKFLTDHGEEIFYKISDTSVLLIIDKKGNYKKYLKRLTGHINRTENRQAFLDIVFEDAKKYIFTPERLEQLGYLFSSRKNLANILASLCCTEMEVERKNIAGEWETIKRNVLPQGAPTSPVITNIVCQRLDYLLTGVATRFGLKYSRYADDITFSSLHNVYQNDSVFINELNRIIENQGFYIKSSKTRLQKDGYRKEVTGLLVNEKVNVQKRYIKQLRMWLYYWESYGYEKAYVYFSQHYSKQSGNKICINRYMEIVIAGKLGYLKMVKGAENGLYLKLQNRFEKLVPSANLIEEILYLWDNKGIEKAMESYYQKAIRNE